VVETADVPEGEASPLRISLLGGFRIAYGDRAIEERAWRLQKAKSLVKLLALTPGHQLRREQIEDRLWPDLSPEAAGNNFHRTLHAARRALGAGREARGAGPIRLHGGFVALRPSVPIWVDVAAFESATATARRTGAFADYEAALDLYGGDLLPEDRYEDWAAARREGLRGTFLGLLLGLAGLCEARGDWARGIAALERLVDEDPTHEDGHIGLMRLYALAGQRGQAMRQWARLQEALRRDLDAAPDPASQRLYAEILAGRLASPTPLLTPPVATPPRLHNLPTPLTSLIGRERAISTVAELLHSARLLTLTGPGGCGKTRLALAVAAELAAGDRYPDGVWLVELAALADPALVPGAVAGVLGVREVAARPSLDTLADALRGRALLLVLDNCEHLAGGCAHLARRLLAAAPDVHILATSRAALRVWGEVTWAVPPLRVPGEGASGTPDVLAAGEAVALFVDRARWRRPGFTLTPENAPAVAAICRRLDGIPLALELAAARAAVLTGGDRAAPARQRTLRATLDWSHDLLDLAERALFRRLAVFAGGWNLDAAEVVCADDEVPARDILVLLAGLVDQSLVLVEEEPHAPEARYRLLEPVRQYALERLVASGEAERLRERHAAHFLALAERVELALAGPKQHRWLDALGAEYGNLRAALEWAASLGGADVALRLGGALWRFWSIRGPVGEGREWLTRLLTRAGEAGGPVVRAKALASAGLLAYQQGDHTAARPLFEACLAIRRELGDPGPIARALTNLAFVAADRERATALLDEALALGRAVGDKASILRTLNSLGEVARSGGDYAWAQECYAESLALCRETGERLGIAHVLHNLGLVGLARSEPARAAAQLHESLLICQELGDLGLAARCLMALAGVAGATGQAARAARLFGAAQALRAASGTDEGELNREGSRRHLAAARAALGEEAFLAALAAGEALSLEAAVAEASAVATCPGAESP
jgi:predicted ATPase/DNA-binding SARP family transcriptional activator